MKNQNNQNLLNSLNNTKTTTFTSPPPPPISFLPISGPGGIGIGVTTPQSGAIVGVTVPGNNAKSFSYPSIQATNSTNLNSTGSLQLKTAVSQPVYPGNKGPTVYAGFSFKF